MLQAADSLLAKKTTLLTDRQRQTDRLTRLTFTPIIILSEGIEAGDHEVDDDSKIEGDASP